MGRENHRNMNLRLTISRRHFGAAKEHAPCSRGFDKGFVYLPGSGNHYSYKPQFKEGEPRPSLAVADPNTFWMRDGTYLNRWTKLPDNFYSTKTFTDKLLNYFETRTPEEKEKPFFSYLAFTAPHWPLHAPKEIIDLYKGMYDDGPAGLRQRRLARLIELGLVPADVEPAPTVGLLDPEWETMSAEERAVSAREMETFAAMVHVVDQHIQRVLDYLRDSGELDNTFILFISDNGAEGTLLEALPMLNGDEHGRAHREALRQPPRQHRQQGLLHLVRRAVGLRLDGAVQRLQDLDHRGRHPLPVLKVKCLVLGAHLWNVASHMECGVVSISFLMAKAHGRMLVVVANKCVLFGSCLDCVIVG